MLLFRVWTTAFALGLTACVTATTHQSSNAAMTGAKALPFPGEIPLIYIEQTEPTQSVAIVRSCAPEPENCAAPKLKARSIRLGGSNQSLWEFADLSTCAGAPKIANLLFGTGDGEALTLKYIAGNNRVRTAQEHIAEELVGLINPCLQTSYMTPPWERLENK